MKGHEQHKGRGDENEHNMVKEMGMNTIVNEGKVAKTMEEMEMNTMVNEGKVVKTMEEIGINTMVNKGKVAKTMEEMAAMNTMMNEGNKNWKEPKKSWLS